MTALLHVDSAEALQQTLAGLDIAVPRRSEGRTSDHTERYCVAHLLSSLPSCRLTFPLSVEHVDRPDMVLNFDGQRIGVEVTEAIPTNAARTAVIRQSGVGPEVALITRSAPEEGRKTRAELIREIEEGTGGPPWVGDAPEQEWADAMAHVTARKINSSRKPGYGRYARNWLLTAKVIVANQHLTG